MRKKYMTKQTALDIFKAEILEHMQGATNTTIRCAWCDYVDGLQKDGHISSKQAFNWSNPFSKSKA